MKAIIFLSSILFASAACAAAYNRPSDPAAYRIPENLRCFGLPKFPQGIDVHIPPRSVIGNLHDGLQYIHPAGMFSMIVFIFSGEGGARELAYTAVHGEVFGTEWPKSKGACEVGNWYPE